MSDPQESYMGGTVGTGLLDQQGGAMYNLSPPPPASSQNQQNLTPQSPNRMGSITQFATPPSGQQQQYQQQHSAQPQYVSQQQQYYGVTQQQYQGQPQQYQGQPQQYAQSQPQQQYQPQQQQQYVQQGPPAQQSSPGGSYVSHSQASQPGTFAARSAAAHGTAPGGGLPVASAVSAMATPTSPTASAASTSKLAPESPAAQAHQTRMLTDATRKVQEHAYYMKLAMDKDDLPNVLDRAALMVGELGASPEHHHHHHSYKTTPLTPKNYYELHLRALEDMPNLEEYFCSTNDAKFIYDAVQYCPKVLPRLYLQICAASALLRTHQAGPKWVLQDLSEAVKCVQNPVRGLFLRHFLLQVLRDKLPEGSPPPLPSSSQQVEAAVAPAAPETSPPEDVSIPLPTEPLQEGASVISVETSGSAAEKAEQPPAPPVAPAPVDILAEGTLQDAYEFVLDNFIAMNKLWVRIQHLPGDGKSKEQRKRRERERNELRILVGTNLVRLSQMDGINSQIYGEVILPKVLEQIVACGDPLAQAYLMDCIIQVFPDEFHIETLDVLLAVCPKLRDKVNIRTILQSLMDRLANYYAEEELLDEADTNQVKLSMARDSFYRFEGCVQNVYNARGPKLTPKEVVRLQTALLNFSLKCYPGNMEQVNRCLGVCVTALDQARMGIPEEGVAAAPKKELDEAAVTELGKLLSIPLDSLALKVLELDHYSDLLAHLPWENRREVGVSMLKSVIASGVSPRTVKELDELFAIIAPVIRDEHMTPPPTQDHVDRTSDLMKDLGITAGRATSFGPGDTETMGSAGSPEENLLVSKLVHLLSNEDTDLAYEMLVVTRKHLYTGGKARIANTMVPLVFTALQLADRIYALEHGISPAKGPKDDLEEEADQEMTNNSAVEDESAKETIAEESKAVDEGVKEDSCAEPNKDKTVDEADAPESTKPTTEGAEQSEPAPDETPAVEESVVPTETPERSVSCHKVFVFLQKTIAMLSAGNAEIGVKLYLQTAGAADRFAYPDCKEEFSPIAYELVAQAFVLYEEQVSDSKAQQRCILSMIGSLLMSRTLSENEYESLITKVAQYSAKLLKKPDQCRLVTLCSHLFFLTGREEIVYQKPQRALECLQRALKLADASTTLSPSNIVLFVDLLDNYVHHFEHGNPSVTAKYISGLIALITEHLNSVSPVSSGDATAIADARAQFDEVLGYIRRKKEEPETSERFSPIQSDKK